MTIQAKKKLSAKLIGNISEMVRNKQLSNGQVLYRAIGVIDGVRSNTSSFGEWHGFTGDFELINMLTGEVYQGAQFFPDATVTETILNKLKITEGQPVEIALECSVDIDPKYPTGYAYVSRPIIQDAVSRLDALRERLAALPAPDIEPKKKGK